MKSWSSGFWKTTPTFLRISGRVSFRSLTASLAERREVVVHFLAILELFKQGLVDLRQPATFGDIEVVWQGGDLVGAEALDAIDVYDG